MKHCWKIFLLAAAALLPTARALDAGPSNAQFQKELRELVDRQDTSAFFDSLELQTGSKTLKINRASTEIDAMPEIRGEQLMLPLRAVAEAAGAAVSYDAAEKTALVTNTSGREIRCPIGGNTISVGNRTVELAVPSFAKNGRTFLPAEAVSEALVLEITWQADAGTVQITAPFQTARVLAWADTLDLDGLEPETTLCDGSGFWVLQFRTPEEARLAVQTLRDRGIPADPDRLRSAGESGGLGKVSANP